MKTKIYDVDFTDMEYLKNRIENAIEEFCEKYNIQDLKAETQNVFNACLKYIYNTVFKSPDQSSTKYKSKSIVDIDNLELLTALLDYYIYLCDLYGKAVNVSSYCSMLGLSRTVIYEWGNRTRLNSEYNDIFKILDTERERSLSDLLISGKRQPIGVLAVLNHEKGWNLPGTSKEVRRVASVEDASTIAERYKARISDSSGDDSTG